MSAVHISPTTDPMVITSREARLIDVRAKARFRLVDLGGGRIGDLFAFAAEAPAEHLSAAHTRTHLSRLFPLPGTRSSPIAAGRSSSSRLTSPGVHDMLIAACDQDARARSRISCADDLQGALADRGINLAVVPQPVNLSMNIPVSDGALGWEPALTSAGSSVTFRALTALTVVLSAFPQDLVNIDGGQPSALAIELL